MISVRGSSIIVAKRNVDEVSSDVNVDEDTYLVAVEIFDRDNDFVVVRTNDFGQLLAYVVRDVKAEDGASHCIGYLCANCLECGRDDMIAE